MEVDVINNDPTKRKRETGTTEEDSCDHENHVNNLPNRKPERKHFRKKANGTQDPCVSNPNKMVNATAPRVTV